MPSLTSSTSRPSSVSVYASLEVTPGGSTSDSDLTYFAVGADYETDLVHLYGSFDYDLLVDDFAWWIGGVEYFMTEKIMLLWRV